ncbi:hypothetical protein K437DRAFT_31433 [Tilletiaria anomala UBC 951]|uniref:Uncharacterized protein n=1 Tax=Tilletiaria anomala (strain ATCC 24038 / CBS 436.72 / UBC 951) TaxID=1037660 RepID=A0A066VCD3_TILAU|nr:uncharacterized protein K437DRAFT_31433 [Tilletiaria anomala UBC 951]KDN37948.1 hypothetical protein K437DRAFT_31433 [Tilletiaria anomala UBC 951]
MVLQLPGTAPQVQKRPSPNLHNNQPTSSNTSSALRPISIGSGGARCTRLIVVCQIQLSLECPPSAPLHSGRRNDARFRRTAPSSTFDVCNTFDASVARNTMQRILDLHTTHTGSTAALRSGGGGSCEGPRHVHSRGAEAEPDQVCLLLSLRAIIRIRGVGEHVPLICVRFHWRSTTSSCRQ